MIRRLLFGIILIFTAVSFGCAALLEDDMLSENPHEIAPSERPPEEQIEVSNFQDLKAAILDFVMEYENGGRIIASNYEGEDIQADVDRASLEIIANHPVGVYAVSEISGQATRIVAYFVIDISIEYKRTKQQIDAVISVANERQLRSELLNIMSDYSDEAVFRTTLQISGADIFRYITEAYYQNPRMIVMLPIVAVEVFPEIGEDRIFELSFGLFERARISHGRIEILASYVESNVELAVGDSNAEIMLSLANNLIAFANFDEGAASLVSEHGAQNWAATATGALVNASAIGEGFAMAFKALCDELGLDCRIVLGFLDGRYHAWNMVSLNGEFYHIDVAMCDAFGIETSFLKTDADFAERYMWDFESYPRANGTLTYEDVVVTEDDIGRSEDNANPEQNEEKPGNQTQEPGEDLDEGTDEGTEDAPGQSIEEPEHGAPNETAL